MIASYVGVMLNEAKHLLFRDLQQNSSLLPESK
jgi:hypothetical protein